MLTVPFRLPGVQLQWPAVRAVVDAVGATLTSLGLSGLAKIWLFHLQHACPNLASLDASDCQ